MNFTVLLTTVVICITVIVCSQTDDKILDMTRLLGSFDKPGIKAARKGEQRPVPLYMRNLYKQQNPRTSIFSEVSCIFSKAYEPSSAVENPVLTFDLSRVSKLQAASVVKLRVFKRRAKLRLAKNMYVVHLFQIHLPLKTNASLLDKKIVSSRVVSNLRGEWLTFDVTSLVKNLDSPSRHFLVEIEPINSLNTSILSVSIGMHSRKQPMLLVFFQKYISNNKKHTPINFDMFSLKMARFPRDTRSSSINDHCHRHRLYIDFRDMGWDNRIIAPRGFASYYCRGKCSVMLGQSMNPSAHSLIRNLYKLFSQNNDIPSACCVPTELKSTSILYFDENQNIVLKELPDMSVTSCGCR